MRQHAHNLDSTRTGAVRDVLERMGIDAPADEVSAQLAHAGLNVAVEEVEQIKISLAAGAASPAAPALEPSTEWAQHEHTSEPANAQAERLLHEVGSAELAKQAVDAVAAREEADKLGKSSTGTVQDPKEVFARELGFHSYLELFEASTPTRSADNKSWCVTGDRQGRWMVWNDQDLKVSGRFLSRDAAVASVRG